MKKYILIIVVTLLGSAELSAQWKKYKYSNDTTILIPSPVHIYFVDSLHGWRFVRSTRFFQRTTDGGESWSRLPTPFSQTSISTIKFFDRRNGFMMGSKGNIVKTTDGGETWKSENAPGLQRGVRCWQFLNPMYGICAGRTFIGDTNLTLLCRTTNAGVTWDYLSLNDTTLRAEKGGDVMQCLFANEAVGMAYTIEAKHHIRTVDSGRTWQRVAYNSKDPNDTIRGFYVAQYNYVGNGIYFALGAYDFRGRIDMRVSKSTDYGATWEFVTKPDYFEASNPAYTMHFVDKDFGWIACKDRMMLTTDGGVTWKKDVLLTPLSESLQEELFSVYALSRTQAFVYGSNCLYKYTPSTVSVDEYYHNVENQENIQQSNLIVSPNPASAYIDIRATFPLAEQCEIISPNGEVIYSLNLRDIHQNDGSPIRIDVSSLSTGMYMAVLKNSLTISTTKFIVTR